MKRPNLSRTGHKRPGIRSGQNLVVVIGLFFVLLFPSSLIVNASTISEGFSAPESFPKGAIVSVKRDLPDDVELSSLNNSEYLLGVVNDEGESTISFKKNGTNISVALSGEVSVYVSDANGDIKRGDFIGASWLEGIGMKAINDEQQKLVGIAQEDFVSDSLEDYGEIETASGKKNVKVGSVTVRLFDKESPQSVLTDEGGVEGAFSSILGRDVSLTKILIGSLLFIISLAVAAMFVTSSIKGSFISIGRNPMASASIHKGMVRVAVIAVVIILTGTATSYAVMVV